jgi:hypothetical protein
MNNKLVMLAKSSVLALVASAFSLGAANALPVVDGIVYQNEYNDTFTVNWYNSWGGSNYDSTSPARTTTVHLDYVGGANGTLYVGFYSPVGVKSMHWGDGFDSSLYDDLSDGDFKKMTGSEDTDFAGINADFGVTGLDAISGSGGKKGKKDKKDKKDKKGGSTSSGGYSDKVVAYADSVGYLLGNGICTESSCDQYDVPMTFEFMFEGFTTASMVEMFKAEILASGIEFHLSPEQNGSIVEEPPLCPNLVVCPPSTSTSTSSTSTSSGSTTSSTTTTSGGVPPVSEPSATLPLMLGFGLAGLYYARRKKAA